METAGKPKRKSKLFIKLAVIVLLAILLIPRKYHVTDGGSYGYEAVLYSVHVSNPSEVLYPGAWRGTIIEIFPCFTFHIEAKE